MTGLTKTAARILGAGAVIAMLTGCVTTSTGLSTGTSASHKVQLPAENTFWSLRRENYIRGRNDCSNKAGRYARHLIENLGLDATVVVVRTTRGTHAVTKMTVGSRVLYADPTSGRWGESLAAWGEPMWEVTRHDLYANREYL